MSESATMNVARTVSGDPAPVPVSPHSSLLTPHSSLAQPAIEVHDLTVAYRDKPVLWDIDLAVPGGVLMAVVGPNGAGKTTLIKAMLGLVRPVSGAVLVHGKPYSARSQPAAYVPQRGT